MAGLRGLQLSLGLLTTYFLARGLSKEEFGTYYFILNAVGLISITALPGLVESVFQSVARGHYQTYKKSMSLAFVSSLTGSVAIIALSGWFYWRGDDQIWLGFLLAALIFPFQHGLALWKASVTGEENFKKLAVLEGANAVIMSALLIAALTVKPNFLLLPLSIVMLVPALQNIRMTRKTLLELPPSGAHETESIGYGLKATFFSALGIVSQHIDKILLFTFLSPAALATYIAADRISELLRSFIQDGSAVLGPRFAKQAGYSKRLDKILTVIAVVFGAAIILFALTFMPWFLKTLFGHKYESSVIYAQLLIGSVAIGNIGILRFRFIRSKLNFADFKSVTLVNSFSKILSALILIPLFGIKGALASVFIQRICLNLITARIMKKNHGEGL